MIPHGVTPRSVLMRVVTIAALASVVLTYAVTEHNTASASPAHKKAYTVVLINNFMGNTWRPIMERSAELLMNEPPLKGRIASLKIQNSENNAASENAVINSVVLTHPDMILLDAASASASNQPVEAACRAGITVVSFDVLVTAPCAWKIGVPFFKEGRGFASWMVQTIHHRGTVLMDLGTAGAKSSGDWNDGARSVLDANRNVKVYTFYGNFSQGGEQSAVSTLITAHPHIDGVLTQDYGANSLLALARAHRKLVPVTGYAYNLSLQTCMKYKVPCLFHSSPAWVSGSAMRLGVDVLDGRVRGKARFITLRAPWFTNHMVNFTNGIGPVMSLTQGALPKYSGGLMLPLSPPWAPLNPKAVLQKP